VAGGKPLWLMRAIVRDYTRPGDLVCDPCAGGATTLLAAAMEGRRAVGAEMDPVTFEKASKRLAQGYTPDLFTAASP
jgi:site-specific DNA-methyltransferase (adenine-specific)